MKLKKYGENEIEVSFKNGSVVLFSYETPVAAVHNLEVLVSKTKYSASTTKHVNRFIKRWNRPFFIVEQEMINNMVVCI